jgi:protein suppressor of PHYA-105 1
MVLGAVIVWDATSANRLVSFTEHYSETWSLDFSSTQAGLLVSASQDHTVRLWDLNQSQSTSVIPAPSEVCSVRLNPYADNELLFGCSNSEV